MLARPRLISRTGCSQCRKRRKKCDEVKPTCTACRRLGRECVWETSEERGARNLLAKDLNPALKLVIQRETERRAERQIPTTMDLSAFKEEMCTAYALNECFKGSNFALDALDPEDNGWSVRTTLSFGNPDDSVAWGCLAAHGLLFAGLRYNERRLIQAGLTHSNKMMKAIRNTIRDSSKRNDVEVLGAINNLGVAIPLRAQLDSDECYEECSAHNTGSTTLLGMMTPYRFQDERNLALFEHVRSAQILMSIMFKRSTVLTSESWKTIPWARSKRPKNSMQSLLDLLCDVSVLRPEVPLRWHPGEEGHDYKMAPLSQSTDQALRLLCNNLQNWRDDFDRKLKIEVDSSSAIFAYNWAYDMKAVSGSIQDARNVQLYSLGLYNMIVIYLCQARKDAPLPDTESDFNKVCKKSMLQSLQAPAITPSGVNNERGRIAALEIVLLWDYIVRNGMTGAATKYFSEPLLVAKSFLRNIGDTRYSLVNEALQQLYTFWSGGRPEASMGDAISQGPSKMENGHVVEVN